MGNRLELAEARTEQAEIRADNAETRTGLAETRIKIVAVSGLNANDSIAKASGAGPIEPCSSSPSP